MELSAAAVLELWEEGNALRPVERAVALASLEGENADEVARLPLGRRDARLLRVHAALRGPALDATASCPHCAADSEFALDVDELIARGDEAAAAEPIEVDGRAIAWRPPDSRDVSAAAENDDVAAAERVLLERCIDGGATEEVRRAVTDAMSQVDPLAEVLVDVSCPSCGEAFVADVDVARFVWAEVRARALTLLRDVDALARAYGWTEEEVLALGNARRAAYLELAAEARWGGGGGGLRGGCRRAAPGGGGRPWSWGGGGVYERLRVPSRRPRGGWGGSRAAGRCARRARSVCPAARSRGSRHSRDAG